YFDRGWPSRDRSLKSAAVVTRIAYRVYSSWKKVALYLGQINLIKSIVVSASRSTRFFYRIAHGYMTSRQYEFARFEWLPTRVIFASYYTFLLSSSLIYEGCGIHKIAVTQVGKATTRVGNSSQDR